MSFLESKEGLPDFSKAVFSLWFRIPKSSIAACSANASRGYIQDGTMLPPGVLPLIVFGDEPTGYNSTTRQYSTIGSLTAHYGAQIGAAWVEDTLFGAPSEVPSGNKSTITGFSDPMKMPPSFIGVSCNSEGVSGIFVNLQLNNTATGTGLAYNQSNNIETSDVYYQENYINCVAVAGSFDTVNGFRFPVWPPHTPVSGWASIDEDVTDFVVGAKPESFTGTSDVDITPDVWHHLLLSFDIGGTVSNDTSSCRMWMALDDVNYTGTSLPANTPLGQGNIMLSRGSYPESGPIGGIRPPVSDWQNFESALPEPYCSTPYVNGAFNQVRNHLTPPAASNYVQGWIWVQYSYLGSLNNVTYSFTPKPLPASGHPIGIPATAKFSAFIYPVQLAELQIFTGVTLDTSVEKNRRAFINAKGQPVDEAYGVAKYRGIYGPKTPNVTPSAPIKLLGRRPDVAIVRSARNWMSGFDFNKTSFRPHGKIRPVKPDPVLGR